MAKAPSMSAEARDFTEKNTDRAMRAANDGMNLLREIAEQNLAHSRAVLEGYLTTARRTIEGIDHQASDIRERSLSLAQATVANAFEFAHAMFRIKEPQQLVQLQSEFVGRQAQVLAEQSKELGQRLTHEADEVVSTAMRNESARRRSEAA